MGTAGAVLDCSPLAPELLDWRSSSSLSRMVFSDEIIRRDVILSACGRKNEREKGERRKRDKLYPLASS